MPFFASALTFDTLLAAVPFALLLFAGLGKLLQGLSDTGGSGIDLNRVFESFLPPHERGPGDPFVVAEQLLGRLASFGQSVTLVAVPAFLWFSTRAFASIRTALNEIFDVSLRPHPRHFLLAFLVGKLRDLTMVVMTIVLFLASTTISTALALAQAWSEQQAPAALAFLVTSFGRILAELVAFGFILALFLLLYRFGSPRRMRWKAALVASAFAAIAFEVARRLYAFYIAHVATMNQASTQLGLGAIILFVLWLYYSAFVFLLGGVVAETWELRRLQHSQRAVLG